MQKTRRLGPRGSAGPVNGAASRAATTACEPLANPLEGRDPGSAPGDEDRQDQEQQGREGSEASRSGDGERERRCDEQKQRGCGPLRSVRCPGHGRNRTSPHPSAARFGDGTPDLGTRASPAGIASRPGPAPSYPRSPRRRREGASWPRRRSRPRRRPRPRQRGSRSAPRGARGPRRRARRRGRGGR